MEQEKPTKPETDRTFPEDDDTLYREMTVHMPRCYFPTSLGENSILKFAGEEFRRVKNIVCRRYNFNEDKYIRENAGVSPFDSVRGNFEQEVYRRLRKDYAHLSIISIRRSLMEKIRDAVKKENNIIGTFYRNCGVHYREAESAEYETSPIVVVHNSAFYGYGGYESATVYELFIDGNGKLLCTLNGEPARISMSPSDRYRPRDCLRLPTGWKNTGSSPLMSMTTRLSYARGAVQTIYRPRHGWIRMPVHSSVPRV